MAFPTTSVLDSFTGTNGTDLPTYSANWVVMTNATNLEIQSNAATGTSGAGNNANTWTTTFNADCEVYGTVTTKPSDNDVIILLARLVQAGDLATVDGYGLRWLALSGTDTLDIFSVTNGAITSIGAAVGQEITNGDSFGLEIVGTTLTCYYKSGAGAWTSLFSRTDSTYSAGGKIGLYCDGSVVRLDEFGGGNYVAAGGGHPTMRRWGGIPGMTPGNNRVGRSW